MILCRDEYALDIARLSRVCGGDPVEYLTRWILDDVFPAYAGVILYYVLIFVKYHCLSRVCGGDPGLHFH